MRKKNEKNFWDMEIIGNRRKKCFIVAHNFCLCHFSLLFQLIFRLTSAGKMKNDAKTLLILNRQAIRSSCDVVVWPHGTGFIYTLQLVLNVKCEPSRSR